jgi:hypothetical protein
MPITFKKPPEIPVKNWDAGMVFLLTAIVLFLFFTVSAFYETKFFLNSNKTTGEVIKLNAGRSHVTIKFRTKENEEIEYPQNGFIHYNLGDKVTILYDAERPGRFASTNAIGALWTWTIATFALSFIFFIASATAFRTKKDIFRH